MLLALYLLSLRHLPHLVQGRRVDLMIGFDGWRQGLIFLLGHHETLRHSVAEIVSMVGSKLVFLSEAIDNNFLISCLVALVHRDVG